MAEALAATMGGATKGVGTREGVLGATMEVAAEA